MIHLLARVCRLTITVGSDKMKTSSKLIERICKKMRRRTRSGNKDKKPSDLCKTKTFTVGSPVDTSRSPDSVAIGEQAAAASWSLELARGAFQDSTVTVQTRPCSMAAVEAMPTATTASSSLPARMDSHAVTASSAPLLQVQPPPEESEREPLSPPDSKLGGIGKEMVCMLSATDSGLYSEEEGSSEDEYLDVFSEGEEDEEEEGLVDDGWLIPADEVALDKVVTSSSSETVYR